LSAEAFTGQAFHRLAAGVTDEQLEKAQIGIARAAVERFGLSTDVLAFDTTNFDTHIATATAGDLARRGHAKSKRSDLRVVGLAILVSETGHVPLLHRTYPGNGSDQAVLGSCLDGLGKLHDALDVAEQRTRPACRTLVRDGGSWSEQLELDLDVAGYFTLISLPLSHRASELALKHAARRGAMKPLGGALGDVRAARLRTSVGELDRTLVVVESQELLRGQKRGIAAALLKAKEELRKLERRAASGRIKREALESRVQKALRREHLAEFVVAEITERDGRLLLDWHVDRAQRRLLERTRLGRRVLSTDRHIWSTGRIAHAFRGQWNVEELFRRAKKRRGGAVGTISSVVRQLSATTHLRHRDWPRTGQSGTPGKRHSKVRTGHDENAVRHRSDISPNPGETAGAPRHGSARAGSDARAAVLCRDLRTWTVDACTSFI